MTACGSAAGCSAAAGHPAATTAPAAAGPFVYGADTGRNEISQFGSSPGGSGTLRPLTPKAVASGPGPYDVAVSPQGTSVYAVDSPSSAPGEISQYTINAATGKLTPKAPRTVPTAAGPSGIIAIPRSWRRPGSRRRSRRGRWGRPGIRGWRRRLVVLKLPVEGGRRSNPWLKEPRPEQS